MHPFSLSRRTPAWLAALVVMVNLLGAWNVRAQVGQPDGFNAADGNLNGAVRAMFTQNDGKVVVVGDFTSAAGTARGRIARFNPDGTLDAGFAAGASANGTIRAIVQNTADGTFYVGGDFTSYDQTACSRVMRLLPSGLADTSYNSTAGPNGSVYALAFLPPYLIIGGDFTKVGAATRNHLALLKSSGALEGLAYYDAAGVNGIVHTILYSTPLYSSAAVFIGGDFTSVNGSKRNHVAKLTPNGVLDTNFNADAASGPNGTVYALADDGNPFSTSLYIGGDFTTVGGTSHPKLAAVSSSTGALSASFTPNANGAVRAFLRQTQSSSSQTTTTLTVAGDFTAINSTPRARIARLTGVISNVYPYSVSWNPDPAFDPLTAPNDPVLCLGALTDSKTLLGGQFTAVNSLPRANLARLYGDAGVNPPATPAQPAVGPGTDSQLLTIWSGVPYALGYRIERSADGISGWTQVSPDGISPAVPFIDKGLDPAATYFYRVRAYSSNGEGSPSPGTSATTLSAPWTAAGAVDLPFATAIGSKFNSSLTATALQPDGKILAAGYFTAFNGVSRLYFLRLNADGSPDINFSAGAGASPITAIALQNDGKILIGGNFSTVNNVARQGIARLNADGSLDTAFAPPSGTNGIVKGIAAQPDGKALIAGGFTTVNGTARASIARLNTDGSLDPGFNPGTGLSTAYGLALQPDGKVIVFGDFQSVSGVARGDIARFNTDGGLDTGFAAGSGADSYISAARPMPDGRIVVAGNFHHFDGTTRNGVARLLANGRLDLAFDSGGAGVSPTGIEALAVQIDGKIVLTGAFEIAGGAVRHHLARLNADGSIDQTFQPGLGFSGGADEVLLQSDGKIVLGGVFGVVNGVVSAYCARLLADNGSAAPAAPDPLRVVSVAPDRAALAWADVAWESGYVVEHSADGSSGWTQVAATAFGVPACTITGLAPGSAHFYRVRAYSTNGQSAPSASMSVTTYSLYQQWKVDHGLAANAPDNGDADGDGLANFLEYALGSDPTVAASHNLPTTMANDGRLELHYNKAQTDATYEVQSSTDLMTWSADDVYQGDPPGPAITAYTRMGPQAKFLRLQIRLPQN